MIQLLRGFIYFTIVTQPSLAFSDTPLASNSKPSSTDTQLNELSQDWQQSESHKNITIYTRSYEDSNFDAFKAVAKIDQSIESIFAVISDPTSCPLWVDNCIESYNYVKHPQDTFQFKNRYGYALSHLPWPFKNRDLIVNIVTSNNPDTNEITITMSSDKELISDNDEAVHITDSYTKYILRSIKKDQTELIWMQHTEPAGKLPAWLVNSMIISLPLKSTSNLENIAKLKKYQDAMIEFDSQKKIQGLKFRHEK